MLITQKYMKFLSGKHIPNYKTKQKMPKSVFLNKSLIPCTKTKKQKNKKGNAVL